MTGAIFMEQLKRSWKSLLGVGLLLMVLGFYVSAIIQEADTLQQYHDILGSMPPQLLATFGLSEAETLATLEGFVGFAFFTYGALVVATYAVIMGLNVISNDEDDAIMDLVLSLPIPRWHIIAEKFAAYAVIALGLSLFSSLGVFAGAQTLPADMAVDLGLLFVASLNMIPLMLSILAFTVFVSSLTGDKRIVAAVAGGFVVVSYFVFTVSNMTEDALSLVLGAFSVFYYFDAEGTVNNGISYVNVLILLMSTAVLFAGSLFMYERRDIQAG
jgi:ABC-type transport system involved in multi-copper enzyme maturation permease subunit